MDLVTGLWKKQTTTGIPYLAGTQGDDVYEVWPNRTAAPGKPDFFLKKGPKYVPEFDIK